jgi:hypothetical protein
MSDTNQFGGGNPNSLYVPMSPDEQEVLMRLVESQTLRVHVYNWDMKDIVPTKVSYGDKRVAVVFRVEFDRPAIPVGVAALDLELRTDGGYSLFRKLYPTINGDGSPILVGSGVFYDLQWDIAIDHMDPALVKTLKPGALGLTTRRLDRDTGSRTLQGNMQMSMGDRKTLHELDKAEAYVRRLDPRDK